MPIDVDIVSGDSAATPDASAIAAFLGVSENGAGSVYRFLPGDDVQATLGDGPGTEDVLFHLRNGGVECLYAGATKTSGSWSSVTQTGTGPAITIAGTPLNKIDLKIKVKTGGVNGTAIVDVALDGASYDYTYTVPDETPAVLVGTVDLAALSYPYTGLNTKHLDFTAPSAAVITFGTGYANAQAIADAFNAAAVLAPLAVRAEIKQDSSGHQYLRLYSTSKGAGVTVTIDTGASDADTILGFSGGGATATGGAATLALSHTGGTLTFPAGTYVANEVYSASSTAPSASISAYMTAADQLRSWCQTNVRSFGFVVCTQAWDTATNARAYADAIDAKIATWWTATSEPIFPYAISATVQHTASATPSTNATNIATNDGNVIAAFNTPGSVHVSSKQAIAHGDCYCVGSEILGKFRKTAALPLAARRAARKLSDDPGDGAAGGLPETTLVHPDGVTEARDETRSTNTVHMAGSTGPGFTVLGTKSGTPRVMRGVTRAGQASRFVDLGVLAPTLRAATVLYAQAVLLENGTYATSASGKLTDGERESLNSGLTSALRAAVFEEPYSYFSSASASLDSSDVIATSRNLPITATLQTLGQGENVSLKVSTVGIVTLSTGS